MIVLALRIARRQVSLVLDERRPLTVARLLERSGKTLTVVSIVVALVHRPAL